MTRPRLLIMLLVAASMAIVLHRAQRKAHASDDDAKRMRLLDRFCSDCHSSDDAEAGVDLQQLLSNNSFAGDFREWQRVTAQLDAGTMPPSDAPQPSKSEREQLSAGIRQGIQTAAKRHAGEPGPVVIRRLTSAEYAYTIQDLTGLDIDPDFVSDAVGGAGFTNTGIAQFMQDSTLERYLDSARMIADRAVIGAGPLSFHPDPGQTGFELSAITRINNIYRQHGFRTAAGEGGEAFGLDKYPDAFYVAWLFRHRQSLSLGDESIATLADRYGVSVRFARHVHRALSDKTHAFPLSDIAERWRRLPIPERDDDELLNKVRAQCAAIVSDMLSWQNRFGENPDAKEEAPVLSDRSFDVTRTKDFIMNINWPEGTQTAHLVLSIESANRDGKPDAVVVWKNPEVQFRIEDEVLEEPRPLTQFVTEDVARRLAFGKHPRGDTVGPTDFVTIGTRPPAFELPVVPRARSARLFVTAQLDIEHGEDCIVRCTISQLEETDQGKSVSGLLANPRNPAFEKWQAGVKQFARLLPQVSQREPAPSDRDPIPPPFDTSYNNAERNYYHTHIKYHRDDGFLVEHMLDDATRRRLDQAWADLLGSFEFHQLWLQFVCRKFGIDAGDRSVDTVDATWLSSLPREPQAHLTRIVRERQSILVAFQQAQSKHIDDILKLAELTWRRPLSESERTQLQFFYTSLRSASGLTHQAAIRGLMTRMLVSPAFLYRAEPATERTRSQRLNDFELASRLSYFLWSSPPDAELRRAAAAGELKSDAELVKQSRRMFRDPKARRFAAEFFGQWFGFYRFDQYRGIDPQRFPEFTDSVRAAMHHEAVAFFSHIVQQDRPVNEILFADYTFLNDELAAFYRVPVARRTFPSVDPDAATDRNVHRTSRPVRFDNSIDVHRGGLLRLGAVLAVTSAPLRTSPVKRGDWILRRVLGTAVPPPPADAGSIATDDVVSDGQSITARLAAHRRDASCNNCHARIDPLGFALEHFDPVGRWRDEYRDGNVIETTGTLRNGSRIVGDTGLHQYLAEQQSQFHHTLCRKLLAYALGRQELVGDLPLLDGMTSNAANEGRLSQLIDQIVTSRQFRFRGSPD